MPSLLSTIRGQSTAVETLRRAIGSDRIPHAYLFDGPDGVGKTLAAWGFAERLQCASVGADGEACSSCSACKRTRPAEDGRSLHPDVIVIARGLYEPAAIGRRTPETQDISVDQIRTLVLARAAYPPHEGRAKVVIIQAAEELSTAAANALLKTLEEPIAKTYFVLLSSRPNRLLPTVRSRVQRVRFAPLSEDNVVALLVERGVDRERSLEVAPLAQGSISLALLLADETASEARRQFVSDALAAIDHDSMQRALDLAEAAKKSRGDLKEHLLAFATRLAADGKAAASSGDARAEQLAEKYAIALRAARQLEGNASPQLVVESMMLAMRRI